MALIGLIVAVALGLISRRYPLGFSVWDEHLGDVLWGAALTFSLAVLFPRGQRKNLFAFSLLISIGVEFFKLTGIPANYAHLKPVRWLLGTTFSWHNLPLYFLGILTASWFMARGGKKGTT